MDELIYRIYKLSLEMLNAINAGKDDEFVELLEKRSEFMERADQEKRKTRSLFVYSSNAKKLLERTTIIDKEIAPVLEERMAKTREVLNHFNRNKQVLKNYQPYVRQINGAFIDANK